MQVYSHKTIKNLEQLSCNCNRFIRLIDIDYCIRTNDVLTGGEPTYIAWAKEPAIR